MERFEKALAKSRFEKRHLAPSPSQQDHGAGAREAPGSPAPPAGESPTASAEAAPKPPGEGETPIGTPVAPPVDRDPVRTEAVLAKAPLSPLRALDYQDPVADLFRILRTQVLRALSAMTARALGVCSPNAGEGKTFVAANLAASLALSREQPVLLIDFDLRRPNIHELFGLAPTPGVTNYMGGDAPLAACIRQTDLPGLEVWTAGSAIRNSSEVLGSAELTRAYESLRDQQPSRVIVCDLPPLLASDDALMFSSHLDATILVVEENRTKPGEIQHAVELLGAPKVIGTVLNRSQFNNNFPYSPYSE